MTPAFHIRLSAISLLVIILNDGTEYKIMEPEPGHLTIEKLPLNEGMEPIMAIYPVDNKSIELT